MSFFRKKPPTPDKDPTVVLMPHGPGWREFCIIGVLLVGILWVSVHLAGILISTTNQDPAKQDQKLNINRAIQVKPLLTPVPDAGLGDRLGRWWPHDTDGVVAPLWSWTAAHLVQPDHELTDPEITQADRELFQRGKWTNVTLSLIFVWALGLVAAKTFRPAAAASLLLLGTFAALLPRAVYFQPEPLYFIFFFLAWVCAVKLLLDNYVWLHAVFGALAGLAYLAKTSVEPLVLGWFAVAGIRFAWGVCRKPDFSGEPRWTATRHFIGLIALAIGWFAVVGPRYRFASEQFGDARHSYPGYWMWFDSFDDAHPWRHVYTDRETLEKLDENTRPSLGTWFKGLPLPGGKMQPPHTAADFRNRLWNGTADVMDDFWTPAARGKKTEAGPGGWKQLLPWRGWYLAAAAGLMLIPAGVLFFRRKQKDRYCLPTPCGTLAATVFVLGSFAGYALLYGFYNPVGRGDRFMLSLYLPLLFSVLWAGEGSVTLAQSRGAGRWLNIAWQAGLWVLNAAIVWRIVEVLRNPVFDPGTV